VRLDYFIDDFYQGMKRLFRELNIPIHYLSESPASPEEILSAAYRTDNPAFALISDVYILGMVDEASFADRAGPAIEQVREDYEGILIFGVTLKARDDGSRPTRSQLAEITRAFNREFHYTPVVVVFRYDRHLALANVERQTYRQHWREGEKAGKVSILRDIDLAAPHAGHLRMLEELRISRTGAGAVQSFDELYRYWQSVFDVSILSKLFYKELSNWYFWALKSVNFPGASQDAQYDLLKDDDKVKEHNAKNLIRLLTRLLFVWFIKEKQLIPESLFEERFLREELLREFRPSHSTDLNVIDTEKSVFYKAVLQNLFFAGLNHVQGKREFHKDNQHRNATQLMRYAHYLKDPAKLVVLIEDAVPFMNGGLFDALDKPDPAQTGKRGKEIIVYQDGFSDRPDNELVVPDYIFFGGEERVDLSDEYGGGSQQVAVKGLVPILKSYKFTIAENTPMEEDVALDPELLGKVFENLLASYNPETKKTARKMTGSYYTPREIVSYIVDRSLAAYLTEHLAADFRDRGELARMLQRLLSYEKDQPFADDRIVEKIIHLLDSCAILDPACGSGAFPMGVLQKLVHVLHKLDPHNVKWKERQIRKAEGIENADIRERAVQDIEEAFSSNGLDYGRKLYLIENCIYGVDIQPIAIQISKLRFLISLIVDQKVDKGKANFGIRPLPNLETKFIAANALVTLDIPDRDLFDRPAVQELGAKLTATRHRLFSAKTPATKRRLREEDQALRRRLARLLAEQGWNEAAADRLAAWDPYDQNRSSEFFDKGWMLGAEDGFDIVIGNPPYLGERKNKPYFLAVQDSPSNRYYLGRMDYFYFFFHIGIDLLKEAGVGAYITTNYYPTALGARKLRADLKERTTLLELVNFNETRIFDSAAGQHNMITVFKKGKHALKARVKDIRGSGVVPENEMKELLADAQEDLRLVQSELWDGEENYLRLTGMSNGASPINRALDLLKRESTDVLGNLCRPLIGLESSLDEVYAAGLDFFRDIVRDEREWAYIKPFFKNSDIARYKVAEHTNRYILYLHEQVPDIAALPGIYRYLLVHEERIKGRKGANLRGAYRRGNWWVLNTPRLDMDFEDEKIVTPYRSNTLRFALTSEPWYASRDVYYIVRRKPDVSLKYILALLNSTLYYKWLYYRGKRKGEMLELYAKPLKEIPIKEVGPLQQRPFIRLAELAAFAATHAPDRLPVVERAIDALVFELIYGEHMRERGIAAAAWIEADLDEVCGHAPDFEAAGRAKQAEMLNALCARWSDPAGEVAERIGSFAEKSPDLLAPILEGPGGRGDPNGRDGEDGQEGRDDQDDQDGQDEEEEGEK